MYQSIFSRLSRPVFSQLLTSKELDTFFVAIGDYNIIVDAKTGEVMDAPEDPMDLAILVLLALRNIRSKKLYGITHLSKEEIKKAILDMHTIWFKLRSCSYSYRKIDYDDAESTSLNYTRIATHIFENILRLFGDVEEQDVTHPFYWENEDKLKDSITNILKHPTLLDHLPMDIMKVLDNEYYTKTHEEFMEEKAMVSCFDIVDSLTEDQLEDIIPIRFFIQEALGDRFPRWINTAIKQKLTDKIKELKKSQQTHHTTMQISGDYIAGDKNVQTEIHTVQSGGIGAQITPKNNQ